MCLDCRVVGCGTLVARHRRVYILGRLSLLNGVMMVLVRLQDAWSRWYQEEIVVKRSWLLILVLGAAGSL